MNSISRYSLFSLTLVLLTALHGCAHPISITPKMEGFNNAAVGAAKIEARVGLYIPPDMVNIEVTTPGGGGDNVRYFPYKDIDSAYFRMLIGTYEGVSRLSSASDQDEMRRLKIDYIITPELVTNSGSTGFFTWPPTSFTVDLSTKIRSVAGFLIANPRAVGHGQVSGFSEFGGDFGLAGRRAMDDAILKMQRLLLDPGIYRSATSPSLTEKVEGANRRGEAKGDFAAKLSKLKDLLEKGLITQSEYESKRREVISGM